MSFYHEGYRFVPWRQEREWRKTEWAEEPGMEPDLPNHIYCELLAFLCNEPSSGLSYPALGLVRWPENESEPQGLKPVSEELATLLEAGRIYPPAIAIARNAIGWLSGTEDASQAESVKRFTIALRDELENQRSRPFFLAKSLVWHHIAYVQPGDYCWILRYDPKREEPLWYVSRDYFAYTCPVEEFDVDVAYLCERFGVSPAISKDEIGG